MAGSCVVSAWRLIVGMLAVRSRDLGLALSHHGGVDVELPADPTLLPSTPAPDVAVGHPDGQPHAAGPGSDAGSAPGSPPPASPELRDQDLLGDEDEPATPS